MIVRLTGGLGNQLFMYAFGQSMSLRRNEPVQFNLCLTRPYALDAYNVKVELARKPVRASVYDEPGFAFDPKALEQPAGTYFKGYWQSEKYFANCKDEIRKQLTLKEVRPEIELVADLLRNQNSVFLHVRRGDYLNASTAAYHGNLGEDYYKNAINYILESVNDPKFVVFSDGPEWCRQNTPYPVIHFNQHEDLYLMSQCRHGIGANSTFSWFGNWLGDYENRVNIFPKKWFNVEIDTSTLIPERWVKI